MIKKLAYRFLHWYCRSAYFPDISGDLEEMYQDRLERNSRTKCDWLYARDVLFLFRPSLIKKFGQNSKNNQMLVNHFKVSYRHLSKHKSYAIINVLGLALGISGFLIIQLYTSFEHSYDSFHQNADELHRVSFIQMEEGVVGTKDAMASYPLGMLLKDNLPEVKSYTVSKKLDDLVIRYGDKSFKEDKAISADSTFLSHFTYQAVKGNPDTYFDEPLTVVLTESMAQKYFGDDDPMGKTIEVLTPYQVSLKVVGVIEDVPYNTHYRFDMMISDLTLAEQGDYNSWNNNNWYLYLRLTENADLASMQSKMMEMADDQYGEDNNEYWVIDPVQQIHLNSDYTYEPQIHGNKQAVTIMTIIGWILIIIAWVNYINLATAKSVERAKEVGLRKVVGAVKGQIVFQFIAEAILINILAIVASIILLELALPYYQNVVGTTIIDHFYQDGRLVISLFSVSLIGAIISGIYPALIMSNFQPATILKGAFSTSRTGVVLRRVLVTMQFAASFTLITSTFIVSDQVRYMQFANKGIDVDHVITFELPQSQAETDEGMEADLKRRSAFKIALEELPNVVSVGGTSNVPGGNASDINSTTSNIIIPGFDDEIVGTTYVQWCDDKFFDVVDADILIGRLYDHDMPSDSNAVMVNEAFLRKVGLPATPEAAIQRRFKMWGEERVIAGVIRDFNRTTLKSSVEPTIYMQWANPRIAVLRLNPDNYLQGIRDVEEVWESHNANLPFNYTFLDERFERLYIKDFIFGKVFLVFSIISIFVSMLGLFGLSSFSVIQRTKEMGVRKVLGASTLQVAFVFLKDFFVLLTTGILLGAPVVYFGMENWLNNYAFRIDFPWMWLVVAGVIVIGIAMLSIGYQIRKVTTVNPAETLKYE
jgi:putative ABC transport system permease protein